MLLHDTAIAHIAKLLQTAIITGTDVVDHLRLMRLEYGENDFLKVTDECQERFDEQIADMLNEVLNPKDDE